MTKYEHKHKIKVAFKLKLENLVIEFAFWTNFWHFSWLLNTGKSKRIEIQPQTPINPSLTI